MKFTDFDKQMRVFENNTDNNTVLNGMYIIARLDGRNFHDWIRIFEYERPFDKDFRDLMVMTTINLMTNSGFKIIYGYTQSDEISLLFDFNDQTFNRKIRKIDSVLASCCTAYFNKSAKTDIPAMFDCRTIALPRKEDILDYFLWRQEDASRNALNNYCYWLLRSLGNSKGQATSMLNKKSVSDKNELLFKYHINYNDKPNWEKRGIGVYYTTTLKEGYNWKKEIEQFTIRKQITVNYDLEMKGKYTDWLESTILK